MNEIIVRPTMKFIYLGYATALVIVLAVVFVTTHVQWPAEIPPAWRPWIPWLSALLFLWPLRRHFRNRMTKATILGDRLRYESGLMSRTTRTILLTRVQDVTVRQSIGQRIFGVGDLTIETAGESSRETLYNIDGPQEIADIINQRAQIGPSKDQLA